MNLTDFKRDDREIKERQEERETEEKGRVAYNNIYASVKVVVF